MATNVLGTDKGPVVRAKINEIVSELGGKAIDSEVVHNTGAETIVGVKTFSSSPVVPDSSFSIAKTTGLQSALDAKGNLSGGNTWSGNQNFGGLYWDDTNNRLGVGTLSPSAPLHVMGEMRLGNTTGTGYSTWLSADDTTGGTLLYADPQVATAGRPAYLRMFRNTNTTGNTAIQIFKGNGTVTLNALISGNGSSYVSADNGNFGVGTNNPTTKFQLVGIPTSSIGLPSGGVWKNGTVLNIV